jgi:hypothetical protein
MPCLLVLIGLMLPRLALVLLALFKTTYLVPGAFASLIWPVLGFFFAPYTTLAWAFAMNANGGAVNGIYLVLVIIAVLADLGVLGGAKSARTRRVTVVKHRP